jgi:hypothetical protein
MAQPPLLPSSDRLELTRLDGDYAPVETAIRAALNDAGAGGTLASNETRRL